MQLMLGTGHHPRRGVSAGLQEARAGTVVVVALAVSAVNSFSSQLRRDEQLLPATGEHSFGEAITLNRSPESLHLVYTPSFVCHTAPVKVP
jgi:hypothetical protein